MHIRHLALPVLLALTACNGDDPDTSEPGDTSDTTDTSQAVAVTVSPATADVRVGQTQTFQATVTGTSDTQVTWTVDGAGSIDASGVYTAPGTVPDPDEVVVRATSDADASAYDEAVVTVLPAEQLPVEPWVLFAGGTSSERAYDIVPLADGGYVVAAATASQGSGSMDGWLLRLDAAGALQWQTVLGAEANQNLFEVVPLAAGGFLAFGVYSTVDDTYGAMWLVRFDDDGQVIDERTLGGDGWHYRPSDAVIRADGDIVVVGQVDGGSYPDDVHTAFVMRLDAAGDVQEVLGYGESGEGLGEARGVEPLADGGVAIAGTIFDPADYSTSDQAWLLVLDADLDPVLSMAYGGAQLDRGYAVALTDGGYVLGAETYSWGAGSTDAWLLSVDTEGAPVWQKAYGLSAVESVADIVVLDGGGVLAAGSHRSGTGWVFEVGSDGTLVRAQDLWGERYVLEAVPSGGFVTAGYHGGSDYQLMIHRLDEDHDIPECTWVGSANPTVTDTEAPGVAIALTSPELAGTWQTITSTIETGTLASELECSD